MGDFDLTIYKIKKGVSVLKKIKKETSYLRNTSTWPE